MTDPWAQRAPDMPALLCADPAHWEALKAEPEGQNSPEWPIEQVRAAEAAARIFWPLGNTKLEKRLPLIDAPTRLLWGSDWPHPQYFKPMPNDVRLLDQMLDWVPDERTRGLIFVDNPAEAFGFPRM